MRKGIDYRGVEWEEVQISGKIIDLSGQRFNRLTALLPVRSKGKIKWLCLCECGNFVVVIGSALKNNNTTSCGCAQKNAATNRWKEYREEHDIVGNRYGKLTVVEFAYVENQESMYRCICDCGTTLVLSRHSICSGNTKSCGCLFDDFINKTKHDIIGKRFGKLTVMSYAGIDKRGGTTFLCLCDCGTETIVSRNSLTRGETKSCGCTRSIGENNIKNILDDNKITHKPQYSFQDLTSDVGGYPLYDFAILDDNNNVIRLIEFDGSQHQKPYDYFGGEEKFLKVQKNDKLKNQYALSHNIPLVRLPYSRRDNMILEDLLGDKYLIKGEI